MRHGTAAYASPQTALAALDTTTTTQMNWTETIFFFFLIADCYHSIPLSCGGSLTDTFWLVASGQLWSHHLCCSGVQPRMGTEWPVAPGCVLNAFMYMGGRD